MLEPAKTIIQKLGGCTKVREITQTSIMAPYRWQHPKEKGGTGGVIPQRYHRTLLDFAEAHQIELRAEDFLPAREVA